jgi:hypothetical protein
VATGTSLWPLVLLVAWLARPRRRNPAAARHLDRKPEESRGRDFRGGAVFVGE